MLDTIIQYFSIGMGLVTGVIAGIAGIWLLIMLLAVLVIALVTFIDNLIRN